MPWTYHDLGDLERASALHEENLERARTLGNESLAATTLAVLAMIAIDRGRVQDAFPLLSSAYASHRDLGERGEAATDLCRFGIALAAADRHELAAELLGCWEAACEETGPPSLWVRRLTEGARTTIREHLDEDTLAAAWSRGRALTPDAAVDRALDDTHVAGTT